MTKEHSERINIASASPGDLQAERDAIPTIFNRWNNNNAEAFLHPKMWEFAAVPTLGDHPQHLINPRLIDESDLLVAMFWSKLGTPTPTAKSGTVEEIHEFIKKKGAARVMVYFCTRPVSLKIDANELVRLQEFQREMQTQGVYHEFATVEEFERDLYYHLDTKVTELLRGQLPLPQPEIKKAEAPKELPPDPRMHQPVQFGPTLKDISSGFTAEMHKFDAIDGMGVHPNTKFYALGAHVYSSVADALDIFLASAGRGMTEHQRFPIDRFSSRLKRLASDIPDKNAPFPKYWVDGREIANDLAAHVAHLANWKGKSSR